jgi:hypothetical protein
MVKYLLQREYIVAARLADEEGQLAYPGSALVEVIDREALEKKRACARRPIRSHF